MEETARQVLQRDSALVVIEEKPAGPDIYIVVRGDGVTAYNGHVDLGTGIRTALAQIVAEELDVAFDKVGMMLGSTRAGPDQGGTIASETLQVTAVPLRIAAAQARGALLQLAAEALGADIADLTVNDGVVSLTREENRFISYADLIEGKRLHLILDKSTPVKAVSSYRVVGKSVGRVDIPAKATGELVFVQDMRVPGMLHGRVVRPPYAGLDAGDHIGTSLLSVDKGSIAHIPGIVDVVVIGDFIGIVAEREENAALAAEQLVVSWKPGTPLRDLTDIETAIRANPSTPRLLREKGDVDKAIAGSYIAMQRTYLWPYHMHGSIGPSCSVADWQPDHVTLWSGTQNPHWLRRDIAQLLGTREDQVTINRMETAGCYGRNCADDVGADAVLLSRAVGRPVRVQLTREQEHMWEPKGAAQLMAVNGGLDENGNVTGYDFNTWYPMNAAPTLALILTGVVSNVPVVGRFGDRTAIPPYDYDTMRIVCNDTPPIVRASWLRGVSALPNSFAHESYIDELAIAAGVDPVEYRLRYLKDPRGIDTLKATVERAEWQPRTAARMQQDEDGILHGQGVAYALYVHSTFPGFGAAWAAWVADVTVDPKNGEVAVKRVVVGQDAGLMVNPDGVLHQLQGNVVQSVSRVLKEEVKFDDKAVVSREWGTYPILTFPELPALDPLLLNRPNEPPMGAGESVSVPSAAAIANAIFDATGVRFREVPFTPDRVKRALDQAKALAPPPPPKRGFFKSLAAAVGGMAVATVAAFTWNAPIAPIAASQIGPFEPAMIARGETLAAIGNCAVCHTRPGGPALAGGYLVETPFGGIVTPNITPDEATGIGGWSYAAFERAMRHGVHRDGHNLYPAFPYASFTRTSDVDLQAIYAYLMSRPPVSAPRAANTIRFPFSIRPLLAFWNALFLRPGSAVADPGRSAAWNRGAYLVEGLAHCGGCHTPRNALGAEKGGAAHLAGTFIKGWEAPSLTALSNAPLPWTVNDLYDYLRTGFSRNHGVAAGPMGDVVRQLAQVPEADIRAMAVYLASFGAAQQAGQQRQARDIEAATMPAMPASPGARIYDGSCAVCHQPGRGFEMFGVRPSLAVNSNIHSARPDNLIRVILEGIGDPAHAELGAMPNFRTSLDDGQIVELVRYLRSQFAPGKPEWTEIEQTVARLRKAVEEAEAVAQVAR